MHWCFSDQRIALVLGQRMLEHVLTLCDAATSADSCDDSNSVMALLEQRQVVTTSASTTNALTRTDADAMTSFDEAPTPGGCVSSNVIQSLVVRFTVDFNCTYTWYM